MNQPNLSWRLGITAQKECTKERAQLDLRCRYENWNISLALNFRGLSKSFSNTSNKMIIQNYKACLSIAKQHYFIHLLVAIETLVFYSDSSIADASDLFKIIFCSWFAFSFSLCLGSGFLLCVHGATRNVYSSLSKVYFVFVILVNTYVIVDQVYYKVNFAHMTLSAAENDQSLSLQKCFILFGKRMISQDQGCPST